MQAHTVPRAKHKNKTYVFCTYTFSRCRRDSRTHHSLTTAHNPPPPHSTRLGTRRKTTHNVKDSPAQGRHDNFTHRTDATPNITNNTKTQTPNASTSHNHRTKHNHPGDDHPPTPQPHNHTQLYTPRDTTHPNRAHSTQAHTSEQQDPKATSSTTHVTPTPTSRSHTRSAARLGARREQRPGPLGPVQPSVTGQSPAGSQAFPDLGTGSGPPRFITPARPPSPSVTWRSAGAPVAAPKPEDRLTDAHGAPSLPARERGRDRFQKRWATGGFCAGAVRTSRVSSVILQRFDVPGTYV